MADMTTKLANLIDPEVMGDMVSARIPKKLRVAPFAKVDDTLAGVPGDTITVPAYAYIGDAADVAEGEEVTIEKMTTSTRKATVKKAMKGVSLTDEAVLSGYGNPVGEANTQLAMAIAAKIDNDCMDALQTATLSYDGSAGAISYNGIVEALDLFEEEQGCDKVLFIHPKQLTALRKDADFLSADKYQAGLMLTGEVGMIAGCRIVPSKKVPLVEVGGTEGDEEGEPGTPGVECYACPIVKLEGDPETEDEVPALTIYRKREVNVETERKPKIRTTEITADEFYVAVLSNEAKVVLAKFKA
ncbi:N4-gp56 family major capsid protein [uncultured Subdoligranulum sp.]|uniref:N4-gp56 family major capsid protein n=1 Tax=uncultured Subdoligranulum sp. TaxID=512298 RepID=UPI0025D37E4B|nr:N4-gp56 family major capsid protein [uncultured Subdoligranulum sp.]